MWKRPAGLFFILSLAAAGAAFAVCVAVYVTQPTAVAEAQTTGFSSEGPQTSVERRQTSNAITKSDRVALLRDSASYVNFDPSVLALAISSFTGRPDSPDNTNGLLNEGQIAGIASRLRLTARQAEYWPPVAEALRDIGRKYFQVSQHKKRPHRIEMKDSPEVRRLVETAMPLIQQLNEDQKREVRQLVRIIGMEKVASLI